MICTERKFHTLFYTTSANTPNRNYALEKGWKPYAHLHGPLLSKYSNKISQCPLIHTNDILYWEIIVWQCSLLLHNLSYLLSCDADIMQIQPVVLTTRFFQLGQFNHFCGPRHYAILARLSQVDTDPPLKKTYD